MNFHRISTLSRALFLALAAIALLASCSGRKPHEDPVYKGRKLSEWIDQLGTGQYQRQVPACRMIAEMGPSGGAAAPALMQLLTTASDGVLQGEAQRALGALGPAAAPEVIRALRDPAKAKLAAGALLYFKHGSAQLLPDLIRDLDAQPAERASMTRVGINNLASARDPECYDILMREVQNVRLNELTRVALGSSLAAFVSDASTADCMALLASGDVVTRRAMLLALVRPYPARLPAAAIESLARRADDPDAPTRIALAQVLGYCFHCEPDGAVTEALMRLGADPVPEVRYSAARGMETYLRNTNYARADMAAMVQDLYRDQALVQYWTSRPTKYTGYF